MPSPASWKKALKALKLQPYQTVFLNHGYGKTTLMAEALHEAVKAHPGLNSSDVLVAAADGTIHHVGKANDVTIDFELKTDSLSEQILELAAIKTGSFSTSIGAKYSSAYFYNLMYGSHDPMVEPPITSPAVKPQLQPVFEALTAFAEKHPPTAASMPHYTATYSQLYLSQPTKPMFTFNGIDFPAGDIETITQSTTKEGWPSYAIKLKPLAYDKWKALLEGHKALPFKMEAP